MSIETEARTTVRMSREQHKRLRIMAAVEEKSINDFILDLLEKEAARRGVDKILESKG